MTDPWLPYLATDYIKRLRPRTVFEWGSGDSTLFFFELGVQYLITIEHDPDWHKDIIERLARRDIAHLGLRLVPGEAGELGPDKANPAHYKSGSTLLGEVNFKKYVTTIDQFARFDLVLIDGMARASCLSHAFRHVAPGGCIVIDNTGDRPYYLEQTAHLFGGYDAGWERVDVMGYGPQLEYKWQTTFFINRSKSDYEQANNSSQGRLDSGI